MNDHSLRVEVIGKFIVTCDWDPAYYFDKIIEVLKKADAMSIKGEPIKMTLSDNE